MTTDSSSDPSRRGDPYCGACGHLLTGLVDSTKCPECGGAILDVLTRSGNVGRHFRSEVTLFGLPLLDVAFGAAPDQPFATARGVFAFGDKARGVVAVGRKSAFGVVAIGGVARGIFAIGGLSIGVVSSWGGISIGALSAGGLAIGALVFGAIGIGIATTGAIAIGLFTRAALSFGLNAAEATLGPAGPAFQSLAWFFGAPGNLWAYFLQPNAIVAGLPLLVAALVAVVALGWSVKAGR